MLTQLTLQNLALVTNAEIEMNASSLLLEFIIVKLSK